MVPEKVGESGPTAGDTRADRSTRHPENLGDLVVIEVTDVTNTSGWSSTNDNGRRDRRRASASAALVAMRYTQVLTLDRPSNDSIEREI